MKRVVVLLMAVGWSLGLGSGPSPTFLAEAQPAKVEVCHRPPGNPNNYQTITISANALPAHLAHGDLPGACATQCDALCNDGNACTVGHGVWISAG